MPSFDSISEAPISYADVASVGSGVTASAAFVFPSLRIGGEGRVAPDINASGALVLPGISGSGTAARLIQSNGVWTLPGLSGYGEAAWAPVNRSSGSLSFPALSLSGDSTNGPPPSADGALTLPGITAYGDAILLVEDPGPSTRQSSVSIDLRVFGDYFDELDGKLNDMFKWEASGTRLQGTTGNGSSAGQGDRFWYQLDYQLQDSQHVDIDLYSYLTTDGGKGFGQDQLGLGVVMNEVTMLYIHNKNPNGFLTLGGASLYPWTSLFDGLITVPPGKRILAYTRNTNAWDVTKGSSQYLRLSATSTCIFDIAIEGRYRP